MLTLVTNATPRVAAQLVVGTSAEVRRAATDIEDVTVITCRDEDAPLVVAALRKARVWFDRGAPPRPARGGTRKPRIGWAEAAAAVSGPFVPLVASDHVVAAGEAFSPEMDSLVRRAQRR